MMRLDTHNKFIRAGCFLLLVFLSDAGVGGKTLFSEIHELGGQWMFVRTY